MRIQWLGHSCFKLTSNSGITIVTDPYDSYIGEEMPKVMADIVTISHKHKDHCTLDNIVGDALILNKNSNLDINDISIYTINSYHDDKQGSLRGSNLIFRFNIDGIAVCHMGDIGEEVSAQLLKHISNVDVLLIPIGGKYTIDALQAKAYIEAIKPSIIIPMHYKTTDITIDIAPIDEFLTLFTNEAIEYTSRKEIELLQSRINDRRNRVLVLKKD